MVPERAILVNAFGRGGSNILMNMIASSPDVEMVGQEFWQFYYRRYSLAPGIYRRFGIGLGSFASHLYFSAARFRRRLDRSLRESRDADLQLRHGRCGQKRPRFLLIKVAGYDIFLNARIESCFKEVKFIGLVRNGYGLCDSWDRRGTPPAVAGRMYAQIGGRMLLEQRRRENYRIVRFEDILESPNRMIDVIYDYLGISLPPDGMFLARPKGFGPGQEAAAGGKRRSVLLPQREWCDALSSDANADALNRPSSRAKTDFNKSATGALTGLGYALVETPCGDKRCR
jgi:hypothetical protein